MIIDIGYLRKLLRTENLQRVFRPRLSCVARSPAVPVVHELCHRKEMNHSARFWEEVERILPNYKESKRWLKENGAPLIGRL